MGTITSLGGVWIRKVQRNFQDHGLYEVIRKSVAYLFRPLFEKRIYRLYKIDFLKIPPVAPPEIEGVTFKFLIPTDEAPIREIERLSEWLNGTVKARLESGAICLVAFDGDQFAGFNLISFGRVYMPLVKLYHTFRAGEAWSEQIAVSKDCRKKGLGANLRYRIFQELRKRGYRRFVGGALLNNIPSLKLARRVGFSEFVDIHYTGVLGWARRRYLRVANESIV